MNIKYSLSALALTVLSSCTVERIDRCKTEVGACPGLLNAPSAMSIVSVTPESQTVTSIPTQVVATFSEAASPVDASKFVISGSCVTLPTVGSVSMSADSLSATASLVGGSCQNTQTLTVTLTPASLTNIEGVAGAGSAKSSTYTMNAPGPTATLASPSSRLIRSGTTATIALTYTGAASTSLTNGGITKNETGVSCTVNVSGASAAGATLTVSACSGSGTLTVSVNAGTAENLAGDPSSASGLSEVITVDNTAPTLVSLTPASATVATVPTLVVATFSEKMTALVAGDFVISGTCATPPTVSGVVMNSDGTVATATLMSGTCNDLQGAVVTVTPSSTRDEVGNAGTGAAQARTYTLNTSGPTATLAAPSTTSMNASGTSTIALTYSGAVATTLTNAGITKNQTGVSCTVGVSGASASGATLTVGPCTGSGTITVSVNAGTATDSLGNPSTASAASQVITIDNTGPTLTGLTPASGDFVVMPTTVAANFSEGMSALATTDFAVSGTCSVLPTVTGVVMSNSDQTASATLTAATCALGEILTVSVNPTTVTDKAGNAGTGSVTAVTYTQIDSLAEVEIQGADPMTPDCNGDFSLDVYNFSDHTATIIGVTTAVPAHTTITSTNCVGALTSYNTCSVNLTQNTFGTQSIRVIVTYNNQSSVVTAERDFTVENYGCFIGN